jgi:Leucine-rich repeat (LRR) protein
MCLNLDGNRLSTLPPEIAGMTALQELWIHDNKVYSIFSSSKIY